MPEPTFYQLQDQHSYAQFSNLFTIENMAFLHQLLIRICKDNNKSKAELLFRFSDINYKINLKTLELFV